MKPRVLGILEDLIRIDSVNPHFNGGIGGEDEVARYIEQFCRMAGLPCYHQPVLPGRDNLIIELRTGRPDRVLLFEAHMDTVSLGSMAEPLVPRYDGDRLYGRGACDTKGSLSPMLAAMELCSQRKNELGCDIILCASVDEEYAYRGLSAFMDSNPVVHGAVVGEPTNLEIVVAHKGCTRFSVTTKGKAAHSSVPDEGVNAIVRMAAVIDYLHRSIEPGLSRSSHPLCGSPTLSIGKINGGTQINIVPETCVIEVDRRIIPGEDPHQVMDGLRRDLTVYLNMLGIEHRIDTLLLDWALNTPVDADIVKNAQKTARTLGLNEALCGATYGSDASKLQALKGIPSIVCGPGSINQAHTIDEWVPVKEVVRAVDFYTGIAERFGRRSVAK